MNKQHDIFIYGVGGLAKEVTLLIEGINRAGGDGFNIAKYVVTQPESSTFLERDVISEKVFLHDVCGESQVNFIIAVGTPAVRRRIVSALKDYDICYPILIHPSSRPNSTVSLGEGVIICSNVILTADVAIGAHTYINFVCSIAHDVEIGEFVQINPHSCINGNVKIGDECLIGAGSVIHQGVHIGENSTVGLGAVVVHNVPEHTTVIGNPARKLTTARQN